MKTRAGWVLTAVPALVAAWVAACGGSASPKCGVAFAGAADTGVDTAGAAGHRNRDQPSAGGAAGATSPGFDAGDSSGGVATASPGGAAPDDSMMGAPQPAEGCPTSKPIGGQLLQGFDDPASTDTWRVDVTNLAEGSTAFSTDTGRACAGSLLWQVSSFQSDKPEVVATGDLTGKKTLDWSKRTTLHQWVRLGHTSGDTRSLAFQPFVAYPNGNSTGGIWKLTELEDGRWHDIVINFRPESPVLTYGLVMWLDVTLAPLPADSPQVELYIDDVWLE